MSANDSPLAHHFGDLGQQHAAATLGMWIFLGTELMFFGGLFTGYAVYRHLYPEAFAAGSAALNVWFAGANTLVLLTSSLTMALAVWAAQAARRDLLVGMLAATAGLGALFLVVKGFEYHHDYEQKLIPGEWYKRDATTPPGPRGGAGPGEEARKASGDVADPTGVPRDRHQPAPPARAAAHDRHEEMFFMFYYVMTGVHAVHLVIGIGIMAWLIWHARRGRFTPRYYSPVEVGGLYWHFVDVVWIFLLPLLYLIGGAR